MLYRVATIAENAWMELRSKKALWLMAAILVVVLLAPLFVERCWIFPGRSDVRALMTIQSTVYACTRIILFIALCTSVLYASSSVESEVSRRTLSSVLIRPITRWEYLAGRAGGILLFFGVFVLATVLLSTLAALLCGTPLPLPFLFGVFQRVCADVAWIVIALSLAAISSSPVALSTLTVLGLASIIAPHLPDHWHWSIPLFKQLIHDFMPNVWETDFLKPSITTLKHSPWPEALLFCLENVMYGITVFLGAAWWFTKSDLTLKE